MSRRPAMKVDRYGWRRRREVPLPSAYGVLGWQSVMREQADSPGMTEQETDRLFQYLDTTIEAMDAARAFPGIVDEHEAAAKRLHELCSKISVVSPGTVEGLEADLKWVRAENSRLVSALAHLEAEAMERKSRQ